MAPGRSTARIEPHDHDQRREHPDGEEVARAHQQGEAQAQQHEPQVEEHAHPADHRDVDHDDGERNGDPERDHGAAGFAALVPDSPGVAHRATLGGSTCASGAARRASATTGLVAGSSSSVTPRSANRRAETSTRDSSEPTAAL
jgi:hypothetical protein